MYDRTDTKTCRLAYKINIRKEKYIAKKSLSGLIYDMLAVI